jgi:hypothetical protein
MERERIRLSVLGFRVWDFGTVGEGQGLGFRFQDLGFRLGLGTISARGRNLVTFARNGFIACATASC